MKEAWRAADLPVERCWVHCGHALYLAQDIDYSREPRALWHVYYRPRPLSPLDHNPLKRVREVQHLASDPEWAEAIRLAEAMVGAGQIQAAPDTEQTRIKADSIVREAGIAGFIAPEKLSQLDVVPFRYDPTRPPLPEHGLQIGRDDAGTWRTYQYRYPTSTLTSGHASNIEAFWACHSLREIAAWSTTIDIRAEVESEPQWCRFDRESLAGKVNRVGERFAEWRAPVPLAAEPTQKVAGLPGFHLVAFGRGNWSIVRNWDRRTVLSGIRAREKAATAARALAELGDLAVVPGYVLPFFPALREDIEAIRWEATGRSPEAPAWAERCRAHAAEIRHAVAEKVAKDAVGGRR
ncbi:hypothetical protein BBK14_33150 [Parafrankia soli]|uniref:Uncharacterized protein n=1 Tax=Parafrankia soli TaxID=2599596 RepID=A0A1S1QWF1_9ACTN|nr:hypothetical protein [Parafrankia soli]OHV38290.1 hypothetical protein BBK14_33150 [Parafrankia soli]